eukprot:NODE_15_length_4760_cov_26.743367_g12_i0.p1 GENE.NODE_15_length_4760_cov_26.743367_g12_i0~~NODE_15_length_4760_cov_26.743367_g12_i0.p1  ORF type:complete len:1533 (+),score=340.08 NODE_15_length_4760_cov_26.743367_g12_i0:218-4600(+)
MSQAKCLELHHQLVCNTQPPSLKRIIHRLQMDSEIETIDLDEHNSQRYFTDGAAAVLAKFAPLSRTLSTLSFANNRFTDAACPCFGQMIKECAGLLHFDASNNELGDGVVALVAGLWQNYSLMTLTLSSCGIGDVGGWEIADALAGHHTLRQVRLSNNRIGQSGKLFVKACQVNRRLEVLDLYNNQVEEFWIEEIEKRTGAQQLPQGLKAILPKIHLNQSTLSTVDLAFREIDDSCLRRLLVALEVNAYVTELNLSHNKISFEGIRFLCQYLSRSHVIHRVDLQSNKPPLRLAEARLFQAMLGRNTSLTALDLSNNAFGDEGCRTLLTAVIESSRLRQLALAGNGCSDTTIEEISLLVAAHGRPPGLKVKLLHHLQRTRDPVEWEICPGDPADTVDGVEHRYCDDDIAFVCQRVFRALPSLHTVRIANHGGCVGSASVAALLQLYSLGSGITAMDLSGNWIDEEGAQMLAKALDGSTPLRWVNIDENAVSDELSKEIQQRVVERCAPCPVRAIIEDLSQKRLQDVVAASMDPPLRDVDLQLIAKKLGVNEHVRSFDVSNNVFGNRGLCCLLQAVARHPTLATLNLSNNRAGGDVGEPLRITLLMNTALVDLNLAGNQFNDADILAICDALILNDALQHCNIAGNALVSAEACHQLEMAISLNNHPPLKQTLRLLQYRCAPQVIKLNGMRLTDICVEAICRGLSAEHHSTQTLGLSHNQITDVGTQFLAGVLSRGGSLEVLDLSHNKISADGLCKLATALHDNTSLRSLDMRHNVIAGEVLPNEVDAFLAHNHTIESLQLDGNLLRNAAMLHSDTLSLNRHGAVKKDLMRLRQNDATLTELKYTGTPSQRGTADPIVCKVLRDALVTSIHVTSVDLSYTDVTDLGVAVLVEAFHTNNYVRCLALDSCAITDQGAIAVSQILENNWGLSSISLRHNDIGLDGGYALRAALVQNHSLKELHIDHNPRMAEQCIRHLAFAVALNNEPLELKHSIPLIADDAIASLEWNRLVADQRQPFTDSSIGLLCSVLQNCRSVTQIDLSGNRIGGYGGVCLADVLVNNSNITDLNLENNLMEESAEAFRVMTRDNSTLLHLRLERNGIPDPELRSIGEWVELNHHPQMLKDVVRRLQESAEEGNYILLRGSGSCELAQGVFRTDSVRLLLREIARVECRTQSLLLDGNAIDDAGAEMLAEFLRSPASSELHTLSLNRNLIGDDGGVFLLEAALGHRSLRALRLEGNRLEDASAARVLRLLEERPDIKIAVEGNAGIGQRYLQLLATLQSINSTLKGDLRATLLRIARNESELRALDLQSLGADARAARVVTTTLARHRNFIAKLTISGVGMGECDADLEAIGELLRHDECCPIVELDLSNNVFTALTSNFLAALRYNTRLRKLDISFNCIPREAALPLVDALRGEVALEILDARENPLTTRSNPGIWGGRWVQAEHAPLWSQVEREVTRPM